MAPLEGFIGTLAHPLLMLAMRPFLTAAWRELTLVNFALEPETLMAALPSSLRPDLLRGKAYASLVLFDFEQIKVLGLPWPGYTSFPEINLRLYVQDPQTGQRGVYFVKELIPGRLPSAIANLTYNEPYASCPISRSTEFHPDGSQEISTSWTCRGGSSSVVVVASPGVSAPTPESEEEWFKEHTWGYGQSRNGALLRYRVEHPRWLVRGVHLDRVRLSVDWVATYGPFWGSRLSRLQPQSVVHAVGSEVRVFPPERLTQENLH